MTKKIWTFEPDKAWLVYAWIDNNFPKYARWEDRPDGQQIADSLGRLYEKVYVDADKELISKIAREMKSPVLSDEEHKAFQERATIHRKIIQQNMYQVGFEAYMNYWRDK